MAEKINEGEAEHFISEADWVPDVTSGSKPLIPTVEVVPASRSNPFTATRERNDRILAALRSYDGRLTKRKGWPFIRPLRRHAGFRITKAERKLLWPTIVKGEE